MQTFEGKIAKILGLGANEFVVFTAGYGTSTLIDNLRKSFPAFLLQLFGAILTAAPGAYPLLLLLLYKSRAMAVASPQVIIVIAISGVFGCFFLFFFSYAVKNLASILKGILMYLFARFVVTTDRLIVLAPGYFYPMPPFSSKLVYGSIPADVIVDVESVSPVGARPQGYSKVVVRLQHQVQGVPDVIEICGVERQDLLSAHLEALALSRFEE